MSQHYSKFMLNVYAGTPYFESQLPTNYPLFRVLQKCRAFRRLPPNLRQLAELSKQWAERHGITPDGISQWYDDAGNELDPDTGRRLTDAEIDHEWDTYYPDSSLVGFHAADIPIPPGGFADPTTWQEPPIQPSRVDQPDPRQVMQDVVSRGRAATMEAYGLSELPGDGGDFADRAAAVLNSPYVARLSLDAQAMMRTALSSTDMEYDDLGGDAQDIFDRAEASLYAQ